MSGLFGTLNTATSGLKAQQNALQTIGHNVSNMNTPGYSKQRVNLQTNIAQQVAGVGQVGTGVQVGSISRMQDQFINTQLMNGYSTTGKHQSLSDTIGQLEATFNEPSATGLANQISEVFNAWTYLASNPEQAASKTMLVQTSETFVDTVKHMSNSMDALKRDTIQGLDKSAVDANSTLKQLEDLNQQIWQASVRGFAPNDLLDTQDQLVNKLASQGNITVERDKYNRVAVSMDGQNLLDASSRKEIQTITSMNEAGRPVLSDGTVLEVEAEVGQFVVKSNTDATATFSPINLESGAVKGTQEALSVINNMQNDLNEFVSSFANAVNMIHSDNGTGREFFTLTEENASSTIQINQEIRNDNNLVVTGKSTDNLVAGDGSRAQLISSLKNTPIPSGNDWFKSDTMTIEPGNGSNSTLFSKYNSMVTNMGIIKQQSDNMLDTQEGLMALLEQRRESVSGVDINDEVVDMIKYSSAFQANSRVLQTLSDMLDTLINRTGV
ncbi:flagellar hook-associated protein FlgK [Marinilactibacillus sp. Marseille-P9653]|uniref:flagellar hook-associated protein FlgK n=1 Tax=Marinilactibacillus sp. Marseille-P9653 TaxID=2866583 RepID=UPI001CE4870E|nr:flagellar hook-associated protein FlgK [Marinilactibacillus sp. Marseille-P9653]